MHMSEIEYCQNLTVSHEVNNDVLSAVISEHKCYAVVLTQEITP